MSTETPQASRPAWPSVTMQDAVAQLTDIGAPFEMETIEVCGRPLRGYVGAAPHMRAIFDASRRWRAREYIVYEGERVTFDAHWRAASALGHALRDQFGVKKGDRVAIGMRNYPEWSVCAWATLAIGGVLVALNAWEPGATLADMVHSVGAKVVFADAERLDGLTGKTEPDVAILSVRCGSWPSLEALIGRPDEYQTLGGIELPDPGIAPDDDATIFFTSGTTGKAKGAVGSHRNLATNIVNVGYRSARAAVRRGQSARSQTVGGRRLLVPLPLFHVTGFHSTLIPAAAAGNTLCLMRKWEVDVALRLMRDERIQGMTLVPTQAIQLADHLEVTPVDFPLVDTVGYGGAAAPETLAARVRGVFPNAFGGQGYGATETSSQLASNSAEDQLLRPTSVGALVPACDARILDEAGDPVAQGELGELWVRGPNVVRGYWNDVAATNEAFVDGWYRTGDIVRFDDEGFLYVVDRLQGYAHTGRRKHSLH
ncbi:MAG: long-chain fatty acid--CoA ligase [Myxococcota bacterium]|nr:long-chain fatty acid--CoA ligase [Myxococcota bacterium]